ncbi:MAG: protein phosphatase CheZ [Rhodospirillales bacterium]|nr:protein phosphatase CheZ [Alphaproteobacteria bacterium]MBL6947963.1 protein phosphatase CheZ [Rhodospirillales bacterium]
MEQQAESDVLKQELIGLFKYLQRVREEIAAINRPADEQLHFDSMSDQLDAIVKATEEATNTIMECMEKNDEAVDELRKTITDEAQLALLDKISNNGNDVFEACSFQDITGQRVTKVIKSVTYVEDRVNALISVWGKDEIDKIEVKPEVEMTEDEKLLRGPALEGEGISQDEIDKLFD